VNLSQTRLLVDDFIACFRFYRDVLGLEPGLGDETSGYASFTSGGLTVAPFERTEQAEVVTLRPPGDSALVVLEVEDADAEADRLAEHVLAGPVSRPDWGGRVVHLRDPDANLVELFQPIPMDEG
jgi:catechol 2,3-dioxygenase-like lactoylglutathione lyase family enzyme